MNLEKAIKIAVEAHTGQVDKGGNPYILHPLRVLLSLNSEEERIVGVLHDVVEDCEGWTWERLREQGCSDEIIEALKSVSKTPQEEKQFKKMDDPNEKLDHYLEFIKRAKFNKIGRNVKAADIKDNLDISRIDDITERDIDRLNRYKAALKLLGA
jgi:(p)ppGpp synthase/HD superfamily hydrolase